jgi:HEAT repeat protein
MRLFPGLSRRPPGELRRWFLDRDREAKVPDGEGESWLTEVATGIARSGADGINWLLSQLPDVDAPRQRAILIALASAEKKLSDRKRKAICTLARTLLGNRQALVVAEAIDTLNHLGCLEAFADVFQLLEHPSPYVVGSVLRYLARHDPTTAVPLLVKALESGAPVVRQNAVDELDELDYLPALSKIRRLLDDKDEDVRHAARTAVSHLEESEHERPNQGTGTRPSKRKESVG